MMNPYMNDTTTDESPSQIKEMDKYNFQEPYTVSVSIVENDDEVILSVLNGEKRSQPTNIDESNQISSIDFQNENEMQIPNNNIENCNNNCALIPSQCNDNTETQNNYQTKSNSWITELLLPPDQNSNLHHTVLNGDLPSVYKETNHNLNENAEELRILSNNLINVLKASSYFHNFIQKIKQKREKNDCIEKYKYIKKQYFNSCRNIVLRIILPQGKNFDERGFLMKTTRAANQDKKNSYSYKHVQNIYRELISTCYTKQNIHTASPVLTQMMNSSVQQTEPNIRYYENIAQTMINEPSSILQQKQYELHYNCVTQAPIMGPSSILQEKQNNLHYNTVTQTSNIGPSSILQQKQNNHHYNTVTQISNIGPSSVLQQKQNNHHYNTVTQISNIGLSSILQQKQNHFHYNNGTQMSNIRPSSILQQNQNNLNYNNVMQTSNNVPSSILQQKQNDLLYNNVTQTSNIGSSSILQQKQNGLNYNSVTQTGSARPGAILQQKPNNLHYNNITQTTCNGLDSILQGSSQNNYNNQQQSSLDQSLSEDPKTCVYNDPDYEIRLDVNTQLLNNINRQHQLKNDKQVVKPSHRKALNPTDMKNPVNAFESQVTLQDFLQEPTRSTSRDSGFISPCNDQIGDLCNNGEALVQEPTSPYITHVTSLNPQATHLPKGLCHVCGQLTDLKCIGCFQYYYCNHTCQAQHWKIHKFDCTSTR